MKQIAQESPLSPDQPPVRMFVWPVEMMLHFHANLANTVQESALSWMQRRQEAADDAVKAFDRFVHCRDIGEAVTIQQEWLENSIRRLNEDFGAFANQSANLSRDAASMSKEAFGRSADAARAGIRNGEHAAESMRAEGTEAQEPSKHSKAREHHRNAA